MLTIACFLIALAWSIFAWFKPKHAVLWLPALLPAYVLRTHIGPIPTTALELTFFATALLAVRVQPWKTGKTGLDRLQPFWMAGGLWLVATVMAVIVAPNHIAAFGLWRAFVLEPMLYAVLAAAMIETESDTKTIVNALIWSVIGVTLIAIVQFATGQFIPHPWDTAISTRRATGPFPYPNALALYVAPIAALCFGKWLTPNSPTRKTLPALGFFAGLIAIILAKSVGGFIGLAAAVVFFLFWNKRTRLATGLILFFAAYALINSPWQSRIATTLSFGEWSGRVRTVMWNETVQMLSTRPFTGAGLGAYPTAILPFHHATWMEVFQYPHNILLNLWSETGILGIVAFIGLAITWARQIFPQSTTRDPRRIALLLPLIAIIVQGIVDVPYFKNDLAFVFWIFIVLLVM